MAILTGHKKRFASWQKRTPKKTQYLVEQVLTHIVPEFEKHGFVWYPDFADNNPQEIGSDSIPLQKRDGEKWPTVQIDFLKGKGARKPRFRITFSALPEICRNPVRSQIPRQQAVTVYGPAYFHLKRNIWKDYRDCEFGCNWFILHLTPSTIIRFIRYLINWRKFLDSEVQAALDLLPVLFDVFDTGISQEWIDHEFGQITPHVSLIHSWKRLDKLNQSNQVKS